jgi:hypothetical protein
MLRSCGARLRLQDAVGWCVGCGMAQQHDVRTAHRGRLASSICFLFPFIFSSNRIKNTAQLFAAPKLQTPLLFLSALRARQRLPYGDHRLDLQQLAS